MRIFFFYPHRKDSFQDWLKMCHVHAEHLYIAGLLVQCNIPLYVCVIHNFVSWSLIVEYFSFHRLTSVNNARKLNTWSVFCYLYSTNGMWPCALPFLNTIMKIKKYKGQLTVLIYIYDNKARIYSYAYS